MEKLEQRKIQQVANDSFSVTLPKKWIEKNNLTKGVVIAFQEDSGFLKLFPLSYKKRTAKLNFEENNIEKIIYLIKTYYIHGVDAIIIESRSKILPEFKKKLRRLRDELIGAEIIDESQSKVVIEFPLFPEDQPLEETFRIMSNFIVITIKNLINAIVTAEKDILDELSERIKDSNRHYRALMRRIVLAATRPSKISELYGFRDLITFVLISRDLFSIARYLVYKLRDIEIRLVKEDAKQLKDLFEKIIELLEKGTDAFISKDIDMAFWLIKESRGMRYELEEYLKKSIENRRENDVGRILFLQELRSFLEYCISLIDIATNRAVIASINT